MIEVIFAFALVLGAPFVLAWLFTNVSTFGPSVKGLWRDTKNTAVKLSRYVTAKSKDQK